MAVPFMDLSRAAPERAAALRGAVLAVLEHRRFILGPEVQLFEARVAERLDGAHSVGVSSGTDALLVALMAVGVGAGDAVLTTPFSFFATAGVIARLGARPVFVDIDPQTYALRADAVAAERAADYAAVLPVHLFGQVPDLDPILEWAGASLPVVEDAAQAFLARDPLDRPAGTIGTLGAFSFFPTKNLGAMGDAGLVAGRDAELMARVRRLRVHGQVAQYRHAEVGGNFRLDTLQAAGLNVGLDFLAADVAARRANAQLYDEAISAAGLLERGLSLPLRDERHTVHQYVIRISEGRRDRVRTALAERGVGSAVYYPLPFHLQPCFADLGGREGQFPEAERAALEVLALPIFPGLAPEEIGEVVEALTEVV